MCPWSFAFDGCLSGLDLTLKDEALNLSNRTLNMLDEALKQKAVS